MNIVAWLRQNGFILGLLLAVGLAFLLPGPGAPGGGLHPELLNNFGVAVILFLQGLSLAFEKIRSGAGNWRLHAIIQAFTFVIFPLVGLGLDYALPWLWPGGPASIRQGFLFLCVLPSTISASVVLTAVARGNTAAALFNAALSNLIGVVLTPLLVHLLMHRTGQTGPLGPLMLKIMTLTLLPFFVGMALRPLVKARVDARQRWVARISNFIVCFIVYSAFCVSVAEHVWQTQGPSVTLILLLFVLLLFTFMSLLIHFTCRSLRLNREDLITAYFCSVKKTLALGVPLAVLIFGHRSDLPLILLPLMFYHPLQIFINGLLAARWGREQVGL